MMAPDTAERDDELVAANLRTALRRLAKAVVVITARHQGARYAMSATAVTELSMAPPSLLVCVNQTASIYVALAAGAPFCVNLLRGAQDSMARLCSGAVKGEARFAEGCWSDAANGAPVLADAQASVVCANDQSFLYGTHGVFIGRVINVRCHGPVDPLVYCDGKFLQLPVALP